MTGTVYGLGVGPGDPELITVRALRLLRAAPVIAYPAPETGDSFARRIVAPHLPGGQREIVIRMPLSDAEFPKAEIYDRASEEILSHASAGRDVAVLCEGDPFFYGSFLYLYERLAGRCALQVVPGVSSLLACAAVAGSPLARRNEVLAVVPAPLPDDALRPLLAGDAALAIIKVGRHLGRLRRLLAACGRLDDACLVERATLASQRVAALRDLADEAAPYFSMVLLPSRAGR